ncbi:TonB-dependent siderophore receptor [Pseudomonas sp. LRF_L74]|uniref:TonB-dependent siderophore receptor n=1 Tax=Pseudomonas sp. LRF_L74 TaxID=3369422 RepID=UPI003F637709
MPHLPISPRQALRHTLFASLLAAQPLALAATAQAAGAGARQAHAYAIPAGPLDQALNRFASAAGILLSVDAQLTAGKRSPGLDGSYAVDESLARLLQGSGLRAVEADGGYVLEPTPASGEVLEIGTTNIAGSSYETEDSNSYTTDLISVGEKAAVSHREVPQSISVVTNAQIRANGYTSLDSALQDVPGVLVWANDEGRSSIYLRGFELDRLYYDGLPMGESSINATQPDLSTIDHIEILKGPAGLFTASGSPAGTMNMRLKQANRSEPGGYVSAETDENGRYRGELDYGSALNAEGTLRGRAVLAHSAGDGFIDKTENGVDSLYGTLAWDITPDTLASLSLSHMEKDIKPFNGLPTYADGSLVWIDDDATSAADWNRFDNDINNAVFALEQHFDNGARAKLALRQSRHTSDYLYAWAGSAASADNTVSGLRWLAREWESDSTALDAHAELPFVLGGWESSVIVGGDAEKSDATTKTANGAIAGSWDLDDWDVGNVAQPQVSWASITRSETTTQGLYGQLRVKPTDALALIVGARTSWYDNTSTNRLTGSVAKLHESGEATPFAGLTYDLTEAITLYASYSEIFQPQSYQDEDGNTLEPLTSGQYEIGLKSEFDGLNLTAAVFDLRQENVAQLVTTGVYSAAAEVRSRGVEMTAAGEFHDNLHLSAGYTYNETEYSKGEDAGEVYSSYTPRHMLKVGLLQDINDGTLAGWSLGGQLRAMSEFSSVSGSTTIKAPGYAVLDLLAKRKLGASTDLRLALANALAKDYYMRVGTTAVFNFRGEPRTLTLALTHRF